MYEGETLHFALIACNNKKAVQLLIQMHDKKPSLKRFLKDWKDKRNADPNQGTFNSRFKSAKELITFKGLNAVTSAY